MHWTASQGYLWLVPFRSTPPEPTADPLRLPLGLELHPVEGKPGKFTPAIPNPNKSPVSQPFIAFEKKAAQKLVAELVHTVKVLHQQGFRLGLDGKLSGKLRLMRADLLVSILRNLDNQPVLHGREDCWQADAPSISYEGRPKLSFRRRLLRWWQLRVTAPWKRELLEAIWWAEAHGEDTALADWYGVLQLIYIQLTMSRLKGSYDLARHAELRVGQLRPGVFAWCWTNLWPTLDSDILHWKLGPRPRGGYRYWLRRIEQAVPPRTNGTI